MTRFSALPEWLVVGAVAAAAAVGWALFLAVLSKPADYDARLAALEATAADTRTRLRQAAKAPDVDPQAVCTLAAAEQAQRLQEAVASYAGQAGATLTSVSAAPDELGATDRRFVPVVLRFRSSGSYQAAVSLLQRLAQARPQVFAEAVDLESDGPTVSLDFTGRMYCAA